MRKRIRKLTFALSVLIAMFLVFSPAEVVNASNYNNNYIYNNYEYTLDGYDINMVVNENNTFDITETIEAHFNIPKHGIFRKIPLKNEVIRLDGTSSRNRAKVSDIAVSGDYSLSTEGSDNGLKIGDANRTLSGNKIYTIGYSYNIGKDTGEGYDELYFNLIGPEWDAPISNVTFNITMPKEFDHSKAGFSSGAVGSTDSSLVSYNIDGNVISGKYLGTLNPGEALTVRIELPEDYFVDAGIEMSVFYYLMFIIPMLGLLISFALWRIFGKDNRVIETVEFYPPEDYNSLEVGFLYKGHVENKDIVSLLIYLANKGYIQIAEPERKSIFSSGKGFIITKLKDYDGDNPHERRFLRGLFKGKNGEMKTVSKYDLYDSFYKTMDEISENVNCAANKELIFEGNAKKRSIPAILFIIASLITMVSVPTIEYAGIADLGMTLGLCAFYSVFFAVGLFAIKPIGIKLFWLGFTLIHSLMFFSSLPIASAITNEPYYLIGILFTIACIAGMILFIKLMPKRNEYGNEILGKIKGFKKFLETAEKQRLEAMVMDNPTYFYDILPFAYVLDVSDKWIEKFESIAMQAPDWYDSRSAFNVHSFGNFVNSTMAASSEAMASRPNTSSGSGSSGGRSSGGGFSGGGSGGGGGGSW